MACHCFTPDLAECDRIKAWLIPNIEIDPERGCWIWIGQRYVTGYGQFFACGKYRRAHCVTWLLFEGPIPIGALLCHRCDVRACANPRHLYIGDNASNTRDYMDRGEGRISTATAVEIRARFLAGANRTHLADRYGLTRPGLYKLVKRKTLPPLEA